MSSPSSCSIAAAAFNFCVENFLSFVLVQQKKKMKKTKEQREEHATTKGPLSLCVRLFLFSFNTLGALFSLSLSYSLPLSTSKNLTAKFFFVYLGSH
jgi:hypothetical protein